MNWEIGIDMWTAVCKTDRSWEPTLYHRELSSVFCDELVGCDVVGKWEEGRRGRFSSSSYTVTSNSVTPQTAARQASLSITNSRSSLRLMSIGSVMPSNHLILCCPLLLPPSIFPSIRVFSIESVLHIRWPKYWSFSLNISPSSEYSGLISLRMDWFKSINSSVLSLLYNPTLTSIHDYWKNQSLD